MMHEDLHQLVTGTENLCDQCYCTIVMHVLPQQEGSPGSLPAKPPGGAHAVGQQWQLAGNHQRSALGLQRHPAHLLGVH